MKLLATAALIPTLSLFGCALPEPKESINYALLEDVGAAVPSCRGAEDCEAKWAAARRWVNSHAAFRIQIYSSDYIETYWSPEPGSRELAVRVEREPLGGGRYNIRISAGCRNRSGCLPDARTAMLDFDNAVSGVHVEGVLTGKAASQPVPRVHPRIVDRPQPPPNF